MIVFSLNGGSWVASYKGLIIELSCKCVTLTNAKHNTEAVIRFSEIIQDVSELSFFYNETKERCAIILPKELGQLEVSDIGMSLVLSQFDTAGVKVQTVTVHI
ncbi:TPA: hypothetical protein ACGSTL_001237 [Vibrio parahaemolyticus]|uniref:hypothetical protein n=1 Tax=Vibrio campbellii TaxID=680 RepID=UPI001F07CA10|nr:hypothetical protein [Vibrio campbellii]UMM06655.1 hypothetical protein MKR81_27290 [Vibrio campbellii]